MIIRNPGEKGDNFNVVIFATKSFPSMQHLGISIVLFSSFCIAHFGQKTNLKILPMAIFEGFGQYESHF